VIRKNVIRSRAINRGWRVCTPPLCLAKPHLAPSRRFKVGKYANLPTGNHAAIYLSQHSTGLWVMDQWVGKTSGRVKKRLIRFHEAPWNPINDGNAYSVIE